MAHSQTNNVLVYVQMYTVTERGVVGRQVDCSILWLQRLQSSYCPEWSLSRWQRGSWTQQIGDVVALAKTSQAHRCRKLTAFPFSGFSTCISNHGSYTWWWAVSKICMYLSLHFYSNWKSLMLTKYTCFTVMKKMKKIYSARIQFYKTVI